MNGSTGHDLVRFVKMHGAGNDYVYIDGIGQDVTIERAARAAVRVADRHFGVGGDGLVLLAPSTTADVRMVVWNADGSRAGMCGNGLRCLARLAHDLGHVRQARFVVETDGGPRGVDLTIDGGRVTGARVAMGEVQTDPAGERVEVAGRTIELHRGDAGNPHAVVFVADPEAFPVIEIGTALQTTPPFTDGVNVEFVAIRGPHTIEQRTFERGSGETLACGSGATVAALTAIRTGRIEPGRVEVRLRGGILFVDDGPHGPVLEGPAVIAFRGEVAL